MQSKAATPSQYYDELPEDRQKVMKKLRSVIKKNLPKGFKEEMDYGMPGWSIPHSLYPPGYHCAPEKSLPFLGMASQKNYISFYHMGLYTGGPLLDWFQKEWKNHSDKKLDMGKCCVRFKKPEDVPIELLGELCSKITPQQWIEIYESSLKDSRKKK